MSKATKRKHVLKQALQDDIVLPEKDELIVKVLASKGNNLHEVESQDGSTFLASMPTKFRKNIWVKRGDFLLTTPIEEGDRVKAEIATVLTQEHIKYFKKNGVWPGRFEDKPEAEAKLNSGSDEDDDDLVQNTNRPKQIVASSSDESDTEEEE